MTKSHTAFSGKVPELYDRYMGPMLFEPYALDLVSRIKKRDGIVALELACGTGRVTRHLISTLKQSTLKATDLNPDMISVAKTLIHAPDVEWSVADMQQLPFPDKTFDLVVCQFGVMFVPDKPRAFSEAFRVLRKGGCFLFNTWDKIENNGVPNLACQAVMNYFTHNPPTFFSVPFSMHNPEELKALGTNAGFTTVKVDLVKKEGVSPSANDAARGMIQGSPIIKEISERDPGADEKIVAMAEASIVKQYGSGIVKAPLQAWVGEFIA